MKTTDSSKIWVVIPCLLLASIAVVSLVWPEKEVVDERTPSSPMRKPAAEESRASRPTVEPAYVPPATRDAAVGRFVDRRAKDRVTPDITSRMPKLRHKEDVRAVAFVLRDTTDDDTVRNEAANLLRRSSYAGLGDDLISVLDNPNEGPRFRSFAVQHLWQGATEASGGERSRIVEKLREALEDRDVPVRREALLALVRLGDEAGKEAAVRWLMAEGGEGVRDAAIRCVRELDLREHASTIRRFLRDENEVVRVAAIVTLSQWADEESRPAFETAAESDSVRLRRAGKLALRTLDRVARAQESGQGAP